MPLAELKTHPLEVLADWAEARAYLFRYGELDGVDTPEKALAPLLNWARRNGLVREFGELTVKYIIEAPFVGDQSDIELARDGPLRSEK